MTTTYLRAMGRARVRIVAVALAVPVTLAMHTLRAAPSTATTAEANAAPATWPHPALSFSLIAGPATPVGLAGAAVGLSLTRWFAIDVGVGGGRAGVQAAAMPRFRWLVADDLALTAGAGWSGGPYVTSPMFTGDDLSRAFKWDWAHWANFELGWEKRYAPSHVSVRPFFGVGRILNDRACDAFDARVCKNEGLFYVGVQLLFTGNEL